ncbi:MAG: GFA family protein [Minwuia sp.]|nr:GFA family protein [Minwuia sp.]
MTVLEGGCMCGGVRYRTEAKPLRSVYCHCSQCRKWNGAPAIVGAQIDRSGFTITGTPATYRSSASAQRQFCPTCGGSLFYLSDETPDLISFMVATLDDPELVPPTAHIFAADGLSWSRIDDNLPKHRAWLDTEEI